MHLLRNFLLVATLLGGTPLVFAEKPVPVRVVIANIEFEESHGHSGWIEIPESDATQFLKSVSIKYNKVNEQTEIDDTTRETLQAAVERAAEEKCRQIAAINRPEQPAATNLQLSTEISSRQVASGFGKFSGKYVCAITLKP